MKVLYASDGTIMFFCMGCGCSHGVDPQKWKFNWDAEKPTISPSILVHSTLYGPNNLQFEAYHGPMPCETQSSICHSFVRDGMIEYLDDCTHDLRGQTLELSDWEKV